TQIVMTSGIQMSNPVMKYFFMGLEAKRQAPEMKRPGACRAGRISARPQSVVVEVDAGLVSVFVSDLVSVLVSVFSVFSVFFSAGFFAGALKSVAYQPLPLSWKPAALNCFCSAGLPQAGHSVSGGSLTFCRASCSSPHSAQRYP